MPKGIKGFQKGHKSGMTGKHHSEESKIKIGLLNSVHMKGHKVLESTKQKISNSTKGRKPLSNWLEIQQKAWAATRGSKRFQTEETRRKISLAHKGKPKPNQSGEKNSNWKGGISKINDKIRGSLEYILWRRAVFARDNYTCIWCGLKFIKGKTGRVTIHADHIKRFTDYPELRFAIDNGRTLCVDCHKTTETYGNKKQVIEDDIY